MTRTARAGNTQKHTKQPQDATPWEELSQGIKTKRSKRDPPVSQFEKEGSNQMQGESSNKFEKEFGGLPLKQIKKEDFGGPPVEQIKKENFGGSPVKQIKKEDFGKMQNESSNCKEEGISAENSVNNEGKGQDSNSFKDKGKKIYKKKMFQEKLQQRRLENGVTLLAPNQERKIYLIKKTLRQKGMPPDAIKDIIRKKRRAEEIKFRKTFTTKTCFNCRERGHLLSDCPRPLGSTNQVTGVCFKCGSTEHVSYRCQKNIAGYPLAKCFVCKEQGHISKDCPQNNRGVYIKGGCCRLCGNINHLQKDCPTLIKKKEEHIIPVYTMNEGTSIDAEIVKDTTMTRRKIPKRPKVVKF